MMDEVGNKLTPGKNFPIECVDINTHSNMSKEDAIIAA